MILNMFSKHPRVRIASRCQTMIPIRPVLQQPKEQTIQEWREKQNQILVHHPTKPIRSKTILDTQVHSR